LGRLVFAFCSRCLLGFFIYQGSRGGVEFGRNARHTPARESKNNFPGFLVTSNTDVFVVFIALFT
jgi:hypothetical protein